MVTALRALCDWMRISAHCLDNRIESLLGVCCVVNRSYGAVWFQYAVVTLDPIAIAGLPLGFHIPSVQILDSVAEGVALMLLK